MIDFDKLPIDTLVDVKCSPLFDKVVTRHFKKVVPFSGDFACAEFPEACYDEAHCESWKIINHYKLIRISAKNPWLPWFGGECPVPENCVVELIFRDGEKHSCRADNRHWLHDDDVSQFDHVIAYRLLESPWQTIDGVCE